jgi:hypothetical protein
MKRRIGIAIAILLTFSACTSNINNDSVVDVQRSIQETSAVINSISTARAQALTATITTVPTALKKSPTLEPLPTETLIQTYTTTATKSITPTPTNTTAVLAKAKVNANCRSGPAQNFDYLGVLQRDESALVLGQNQVFGQWWQIILPHGKQCWVSDEVVTINGDVLSILMIDAPNTPTPIPPPSWNGSWVIRFSNDPVHPEENTSVVNIVITQKGNSISSSFSGPGAVLIQINAVVSNDGRTAQGTLGYGSTTYLIYLIRNPQNINQFRGKFYLSASDTGYDGAICGGTLGASYPSPCRP